MTYCMYLEILLSKRIIWRQPRKSKKYKINWIFYNSDVLEIRDYGQKAYLLKTYFFLKIYYKLHWKTIYFMY